MNLPIVSAAQMREIENATFASGVTGSTGVTAEALMELVGEKIARTVMQTTRAPGSALVFYGKGNNGGDALVAARVLAAEGWDVELRPQVADAAQLGELPRKKLADFEAARDSATGRAKMMRRGGRVGARVIIDGLLGVGAKGPLRDDIRALTRQINTRREETNARVFAVDLPTGLDADTGDADPDCVVADYTIAAGFAKRGLVADGATHYVGRLEIAALPAFAPHAPTDFDAETATPVSLRGLIPRRNFDSYKTQYGRIGIVAGSLGFTGAAVLCANGALRGGAGLVTVYASEDIQPIIAVAAPAEVMVRAVKSYSQVLEEKHDVLALGPGLGTHHAGAILNLIEHATAPMVLDADGLNIVAQHEPGMLSRCAGPRLLTPHPGEMLRLYPDAKNLSRHETVMKFTEQFADARFPVTLLLKGARTLVHQHGKPVSCNTTGNPGMGTGGMGDVLTGVLAALIGQKLSTYDAARTGAWLCARASEIAVMQRGEESLTALDTAHTLGWAFRSLRAHGE